MVIQNAAYEKAMKSLWTDQCTVKISSKATDQNTHLTDVSDVVLFQNEPCLLNFETVTAAAGDEVALTAQAVTLIISSKLSVPAGSKITVTRDGKDYNYRRSGLPAVYSYHQEIPLEADRRFA